MSSSNSIWDDSECTVEDEYSSKSSPKSLNVTNQFRNVLVINKGGVSGLKNLKQWLDVPKSKIQKAKSQCQELWLHYKNNELSDSFENSAFKVGAAWKTFLDVENSPMNSSSGSQERSWNEIWRWKQRLSSQKILSELKQSDL